MAANLQSASTAAESSSSLILSVITWTSRTCYIYQFYEKTAHPDFLQYEVQFPLQGLER